MHGFPRKESYWGRENGCYGPGLLKHEADFQTSGISVFSCLTDVFSGRCIFGDVGTLRAHKRIDNYYG